MPVSSEFRLGELVRLLDRHGDVPSGSRGHIIGTFAGPTARSYIVRFEGESVGTVDVRSDEIVLAHDARVSALAAQPEHQPWKHIGRETRACRIGSRFPARC